MSNIKELMRQEIERRKKVYLTKNGFPKGTFGAIKIETYEGLLAFIDSLPEEKPSEDLEEAAKHYAYIDWSSDEDIFAFEIKKYDAFIAGAEWQKKHDAELIEIAYNDGITIGKTKQKEQMMKEAVEGFIFQFEDYYPKELVAQYNGELKHGDKVKIIIVKQ